jgi:acyl carrier protein
MQENNYKKLIDLLATVFGLQRELINDSLSRDSVSKWDSLTQMDLVASIEREFDVVLDITDIVKMKTIGDIVNVLESKGK